MKTFLLAARIAALFALVMGVVLAATLHQYHTLIVRRVFHGPGHFDVDALHHAFLFSVFRIGGVALLLIAAIAWYVTAPLRRMSRSMDRIAAGHLDHRVAVRGNDEVAAMGRSFNAMARRIRDMITAQKELMAGVSHELRSPLARMKLSLELLRGGRDPARRIADLESEVDALDELVEELLLASRFDLGSVPLETEVLDVAELAEKAWARVDADAETRGVRLELGIEDDAGHVTADRALVVRALGNLFENAVRYTEQGAVTLSAVRRADRVEITVADEGPGVDQADLNRLFEPFFRADRSRSRKTGAGGLGLMIVRRAVEAHDGTVIAREADGGGLAVVFDLEGG